MSNNQDHPVLGIALMIGFCVVAPMGDAVAKILGGLIPIGQLLIVRFGVQFIALLPLVVMSDRPWRMHGRVLRLTIFRTVLHLFGIGAMVTALQYLPLADAIAIAFVLPFLMLLLGRFVLGEQVGLRRIVACLVGFVGTLLVIQPSFAEVGWPALLPLVVAVNFAVFILVTRQIAKETDPIGLQMVSGAMAVAAMAVVLGLSRGTELAVLKIVTPTSYEWWLLIGIGLLGTIAHLLMTWSLRYAPSTTLAPIQYLEMPAAAILGWLIFRDFPNGLALLGIAIIISAGLYIVFRERAAARQVATTEQAPV